MFEDRECYPLSWGNLTRSTLATLETVIIMKHDMLTIPLAKLGCEIKRTDLDDLTTHTEVLEVDMETCAMIDGHGVIQALGKHNGCHGFGDYAECDK